MIAHLLKSVDVRITEEGGGGTWLVSRLAQRKNVLQRAMRVLNGGGANRRLGRCLTIMPGRQAAALVAIESFGQRRYLEKALDTGVSLEPSRRADNGVQCATKCAHEITLELPGAGQAQSPFQQGCRGNRLAFQPCQQAKHVCEVRRMPTSTKSRVGILPEVLPGLSLARQEIEREGGALNRA